MSFTISINDQASFEVLFAGPAGPTGPQGIQGIQGVPGPGVAAGGTTGQVLKKLSSANYDTGWSSDISGVAWGGITGTLSAQTDLQNALDAKLSTSAASSTYLPLAGGYITGDIQSLNGSEFRTFQGTNSAIIRSYQIQMGDAVGTLTVDAEGISFNSSPFKQTLPFLGLAGYATEGWVTSNFYPLTGNPSGFLTSAPVTSVAGKVGAVTLDNTDISGLGTLAVVNDAPSDGTIYGRKDGSWTSTISSVAWGEITGTLSYQSDLQTALNLKLDATVAATTYYLQTNPDGFITSTTAASTYAVIAAGQPVSGTVGQVLTKNSGTNYDSSWATLIPGDRYLTSSTTSLTINNANKTLTVGTGLSYTPTQNITISYDASNHMHGEVLTYNSGTGVLTVDINNHTGSGTYSAWVVNVGGVTPATSVAWGDITGVLGNQSDLATALNGKLEVTTAASTYFTIASAAGKANLSGATFTGKVNTTVTATTAPINIGSQLTAPTTTVAGDVWIGANINYKSWDGVTKAVANTNTTNQFTQGQAITVNSAVNAFRINQQGTGPALVVEDSVSPDATPFVIDANGKVGIGVAPDTTAALKVDTNGIMFGDGTTQTTAATSGIPDAPSDGSTYGRNNGAWTVAGGGGIPDCPDDGYLWVRVTGSWSGPYWNQSFVVDGTTYYALVLVNP